MVSNQMGIWLGAVEGSHFSVQMVNSVAIPRFSIFASLLNFPRRTKGSGCQQLYNRGFPKAVGVNKSVIFEHPDRQIFIDGFLIPQKKGMEMKKGNIFMVAGALSAVFGGAYADDAATILAKKTVTSKNYVDTTRQPILQAQDGDYAVLYPGDGDDDGAVRPRAIVDYIAEADYEGELVTAGAVKTALDAKQPLIEGNSTLNGKIITYTGTAGTVGSKDVYNSANAYTGQTTALVEARHVNAAVADGFSKILSCVDAPGCTLWRIDDTMSGTYVPQNQ